MNASSFWVDVKLFRISSKKTIPGISLTFVFDRKTRDVRRVSILHWRIAVFIASGPDVKFKLTGIFPAKDTAILASAPPTEAGSRIPTMESFDRCFRTQRESSMLPIKVLPKDNSVPVVSDKQNEDQWRLAVRINLV